MKLGKEYIRFPTNLAGVQLFVAPSVSVPIQALWSVTKKGALNKRPSVTMETLIHDIKVLLMGIRRLNFTNLVQSFF